MKLNRLAAAALAAVLAFAPALACAQALQTNTARTNPDGTVTDGPVTMSSCTPYHLSGGTAASNNSTLVSATSPLRPTDPPTVCDFAAISTSGTLAYLKVYDLAAAPTCSSATGLKHVYPIPASTSGAGFIFPVPLQGMKFKLGFGFCVVGGGGDTDNTNAPTGIYIEGDYR